jgi:hypothetical protein
MMASQKYNATKKQTPHPPLGPWDLSRSRVLLRECGDDRTFSIIPGGDPLGGMERRSRRKRYNGTNAMVRWGRTTGREIASTHRCPQDERVRRRHPQLIILEATRDNRGVPSEQVRRGPQRVRGAAKDRQARMATLQPALGTCRPGQRPLISIVDHQQTKGPRRTHKLTTKRDFAWQFSYVNVTNAHPVFRADSVLFSLR